MTSRTPQTSSGVLQSRSSAAAEPKRQPATAVLPLAPTVAEVGQ